MVVSLVPASGIATASVVAASEQPATSSAGAANPLVQQWLAVLGPLGQHFASIESELKALKPTATDAQVEAAVAPVAGLLGPVEALSSAPQATALESLGPPSEGFEVAATATNCYSYRTAAQGVDLEMGGQDFTHGFQVGVNDGCRGAWSWAWHIAGMYRTFSASIGLGLGNTGVAMLSFLGANGKPLQFSADGRAVNTVPLIAGLPTKIKFSVAGALNLVIRTTSPGVTINFANDALGT